MTLRDFSANSEFLEHPDVLFELSSDSAVLCHNSIFFVLLEANNTQGSRAFVASLLRRYDH